MNSFLCVLTNSWMTLWKRTLKSSTSQFLWLKRKMPTLSLLSRLAFTCLSCIWQSMSFASTGSTFLLGMTSLGTVCFSKIFKKSPSYVKRLFTNVKYCKISRACSCIMTSFAPTCSCIMTSLTSYQRAYRVRGDTQSSTALVTRARRVSLKLCVVVRKTQQA